MTRERATARRWGSDGGGAGSWVRPPSGALPGLVNVLLLGGSADARQRVARQFHGESPLRGGAFLPTDAGRDLEMLGAALRAWVLVGASAPRSNPLWGAECGTLFVDQISRLPTTEQRLLLAVVRSHDRPIGHPAPTPRIGRLIVGDDADLPTRVRCGRFLPDLFDHIDKVRVELPHARGSAT